MSDPIGRKELPHELPLSVDPDRSVFFLTICAQNRAVSPLVHGDIASRLLESIRSYHEQEKWWIHIAVIMPDHVHLLASFPSEMSKTVHAWKHWTTRYLAIDWQKDFFDHRLRREESRHEKADYILMNPVRAGLGERARRLAASLDCGVKTDKWGGKGLSPLPINRGRATRAPAPKYLVGARVPSRPTF